MTEPERQEPNWRMPFGMFLILLLILIWAMVFMTLLPVIEGWSALLQLPVYLVMGVIWIAPLKPLLFWMEHGKWRE